MVANAAVGVYVDLEQMSEDDLDRVIDVDLKGALVCAQLAIPALRVRGGGSIVFVLVRPGLRDASRLRRLWRDEGRAGRRDAGARGRGRRARDPRQRDRPGHDRHADARARPRRDEHRRRRRVPRPSARRERARADRNGRGGRRRRRFLVSDAARYVTGATIVADGGFLAVKSF